MIRSVAWWLARHPDAWVPFVALGAGLGLAQLLILTPTGHAYLTWLEGLAWPSIVAGAAYSAFGGIFVFLRRGHDRARAS